MQNNGHHAVQRHHFRYQSKARMQLTMCE